MKTLIYSFTLLSFLLSVTSCKKYDSLQPRNSDGSLDTLSSTQPLQSNCDSSKSINYVLTNSSGIENYQIRFAGQADYSFDFPASGSKTVTVKPGVYSIQIYSHGFNSDQNFYLSNEPPVRGVIASYYNIKVNPCTTSEYAVISPYTSGQSQNH